MDGVKCFEYMALRHNAMFIYKEFCNYIYEEKYSLAEESDFLKQIDKYVIGNLKTVFLKYDEKETIFYRARKAEEKDYKNEEKGIRFNRQGKSHGFNSQNSKEPPLFLSGEGRNNIRGSSYLYVASDPQTACAEVKTNQYNIISVAKFKLKKDLCVIDFSEDVTLLEGSSEKEGIALGDFFTRIMLSYSNPVNQSEMVDYKMTQFITDHIRKIGVDGICYKSGLSSGKNYTLFNCHESNIEFIESKLYIHTSTNHTFLDINDEKIITSSNENEKTDIKELIEALQKIVKVIDD